MNDIRRVDLFFFEESGVKALTCHEKLLLDDTVSSTEMELRIPASSSSIVAIANSSREFNDKALSRYDVLKQLEYEFTDDSPQMPLMTAEGCLDDGYAKLALKPLMCTVSLVKVSNLMDDYELLEEPRVRLRDMNMSVNPFQQSAFYPSVMLDAGEWLNLPHDVGYYPMEPDAKLYCYPNETPENELGSHTSFEFECLIRGERHTIYFELPPFGRESRVEVSLVVDGPGSYSRNVEVKDPS